MVLDIDSLLDSWILGLALRSLGHTTIAVRSLNNIGELNLRDIGCVVATAREKATPMSSTATPHKLIQVPHHMYLGITAEGMPALTGSLPTPGGHILLTSGTTGLSKKVFFSEDCLVAETPRRRSLYGLSEGSVLNVFGFSMWTSVGYNIPASAWAMGATVVIHQGSDLHCSLGVAGNTHAFFTPAMLTDLMKAPEGAFVRRASLRALVTGGPLSRALAEETQARLTPHLYNFIGSTEVGSWTMTLIESPKDLHLHRVHPTAEVQVVDDAHRPLPVGQSGLLRIRALDGISGYLDDEETTRRFFHDGYFYPGDLGAFQPDGRLVLHGRVTNVVNVLGDKVPAETIETRLRDRLNAEEVCVFSFASEGADEELHVVIQSPRRISREELTAAIRDAVPRFPHAHVHLVGKIPRNDMGKVDRILLKRTVLAGAANSTKDAPGR